MPIIHVNIPHNALQQIGEFANDYIEVRRDYSDWTALGKTMSEQATEVPTPDTYLYGDRNGHPDLQQELHRRGKEEPPLDPILEKSTDEVASEVTVNEVPL
jgi:Amt family ammonium transporter